MNKIKKVYVSLIADMLHAGHINVLNEASKYGEVTVGLLTSYAISELNDTAFLKYNQREKVLSSLSMVTNVISQDEASYRNNLYKLRPDYVVHGDDWIENSQFHYRDEVVEILSEWGGELVEVPYSSEIYRSRLA